jgi:large subunit ribosomal protein L6
VSRVGRMPIPIPPDVKVELEEGMVAVEGPKGRLEQSIHRRMIVKKDDSALLVERPSDSKMFRSLHGLTRTLLSNMVAGVTEGHHKNLEVNGVGYRADLRGRTLVLQLGLSHPIVFQPPEGIELEIGPKGVLITVRGIDKQLVGQVAAKIRSFRPPEPYKGKGIRYQGEAVRRKAGKTGA